MLRQLQGCRPRLCLKETRIGQSVPDMEAHWFRGGLPTRRSTTQPVKAALELRLTGRRGCAQLPPCGQHRARAEGGTGVTHVRPCPQGRAPAVRGRTPGRCGPPATDGGFRGGGWGAASLSLCCPVVPDAFGTRVSCEAVSQAHGPNADTTQTRERGTCAPRVCAAASGLKSACPCSSYGPFTRSSSSVPQFPHPALSTERSPAGTALHPTARL